MKAFFRPSRRLLVVAAVLIVVAGVLRAPASLLTLVLPPNIQLKNVHGSFWNGQASAVGVGGMLVQEQLEWRFQPKALLGAQLAWALSGRMADQTSRLTLIARWSGVALNGISVVLPLEPFAALHTKLKLAQLGAVLRVTAKALEPHAPTTATISIEHLFSPLVPQGELGSYRLELTGETGSQGRWQIFTAAGNLQIAGQGAFDSAQSRINGQLTLLPQAPMPGLTPILSTLPKAGEGFLLAF